MSEERTRNPKFMQTYLFDHGVRVSTGYRQSSAALRPDHWYFETMVFPIDDESDADFRFDYDQYAGTTESRAAESHLEVVRKVISRAKEADHER